jgi:hypothetical protein
VNAGDGIRGYLVANHIVKFGEHISVGPYSSATQGLIIYPPTYYYVLAFFLLINDSVLFLGVVNLVIQTGTLLLIYLIASNAFGKSRGLAATWLYAFIPFVIGHSRYIWPNYLAHFLIYLSFFSLLILYSKPKKNYMIFLSYFTLALGAAIHSTAFIFFPIFLVITWIMFKSQKRPLVFFLYPPLVFINTMLIFYLFTSFEGRGIASNSVPFDIMASSLPQLFSNLDNLYISTLHRSSLTAVSGYKSAILIVFVLITLFYFLSKKIEKKKKILMSFFIFFVLAYFFSIGLLKNYHEVYFLPILGFFLIILSEITFSLLPQRPIGKILAFIIFLLFFLIFSGGLLFLNTVSNENKKLNTANSAARIIYNEAKRIRKDKGYRELTFFQIQSYYPQTVKNKLILEMSDAGLLVPLERIMDRKIVTLVDYGFKQLNSNDYVFIACFYDAPNRSEYETLCHNKFRKNYPMHEIKKEVFLDQNLILHIAERVKPLSDK